MEYKNDGQQQTCLECGREFYGRKDKKFCSDECKNHFHNQEKRAGKRFRDRILTDLCSNYELLETLLKNRISVISLCDFEAMGFKPSVITGYSKVKGHNEFRCFDIKYCQSPNRIFNIRRMELCDARQAYRTRPPQSSCRNH